MSFFTILPFSPLPWIWLMSMPFSSANFLAKGLAFKRSSLLLATGAGEGVAVWAAGAAGVATGAASTTAAAGAGAAGAEPKRDWKSSPGFPTTAMMLSTGVASPSFKAK